MKEFIRRSACLLWLFMVPSLASVPVEGGFFHQDLTEIATLLGDGQKDFSSLVRAYAQEKAQALLSSLVSKAQSSFPILAHTSVSYEFGSGLRLLAVLPLWHAGHHSFFSEVQFVHQEHRPTLNLGVGDRYINASKNLLLGWNAFFDQDIKGKHHRLSVGVELRTRYLRASANEYLRLSSWTLSPFPSQVVFDERPANGVDARFQGCLPFYSQLCFTTRYFQWYGKNLTFFSHNAEKRRDLLRGYSVGVVYMPNSLVHLGAVYTKGLNTAQHGMRLTAGLHYLLGRPLREQLAFGAPLSDLASHLYDKVDREDRVILERRHHVRIVLQNHYEINTRTGTTHLIIRPRVEGSRKPLDWRVDARTAPFFHVALDHRSALFTVTSKTHFEERYPFALSLQEGERTVSASSYVVLKHMPLSATLTLPQVIPPGTCFFSLKVTPKGGDGSYSLDRSYGEGGLKITPPPAHAMLLKEKNHIPFSSGVPKVFKVVCPPHTFLSGTVYTVSVRLNDGDHHAHVAQGHITLVNVTPSASFPHGRYLQPVSVSEVVVSPKFSGLPAQGTSFSWTLQQWEGSTWVSRAVWPHGKESPLPPGSSQRRFVFHGAHVKPGSVFKLHMFLKAPHPVHISTLFVGTTSGQRTTSGPVPTHVHLEGPSVVSHTRVPFTLSASGGTGRYTVKGWRLFRAGHQVPALAFKVTADTGAPIQENARKAYVLALKAATPGQRYRLEVTVAPHVDLPGIVTGSDAVTGSFETSVGVAPQDTVTLKLQGVPPGTSQDVYPHETLPLMYKVSGTPSQEHFTVMLDSVTPLATVTASGGGLWVPLPLVLPRKLTLGSHTLTVRSQSLHGGNALPLKAFGVLKIRPVSTVNITDNQRAPLSVRGAGENVTEHVRIQPSSGQPPYTVPQVTVSPGDEGLRVTKVLGGWGLVFDFSREVSPGSSTEGHVTVSVRDALGQTAQASFSVRAWGLPTVSPVAVHARVQGALYTPDLNSQHHNVLRVGDSVELSASLHGYYSRGEGVPQWRWEGGPHQASTLVAVMPDRDVRVEVAGRDHWGRASSVRSLILAVPHPHFLKVHLSIKTRPYPGSPFLCWVLRPLPVPDVTPSSSYTKVSLRSEIGNAVQGRGCFVFDVDLQESEQKGEVALVHDTLWTRPREPARAHSTLQGGDIWQPSPSAGVWTVFLKYPFYGGRAFALYPREVTASQGLQVCMRLYTSVSSPSCPSSKRLYSARQVQALLANP